MVKGERIDFREEVRSADRDHVRAIVSSTGFFSPEEIEIAVELVEERLARGPGSGYHFVFAEYGGRVVGYSCFGPIPGTRESYDLYWIAIHEACRGLGIGTALLEESERRILRSGGRRVYVETSFRNQYGPTRAFYAARGYAQEALLKDFYAPGDSKIIFSKTIPLNTL
ncbi:MAG: hypothetical protein A2Z06_01945 [Candidatus Glassbacteria bacterium RBG_16_58_8]|uniref:N-acetyltransferase domain-containing protein n=1 Tax=Candidatus Glassbacteria bacterium RBG_16_58_8 TaxID=1817866 RepID=A0A1F5YAK8_9BACT|nr:MAG: hypothetical protein A2Z06_01945 [Candidatus Glassbacteria bacterium RBG_16_58_8]